jgi:DNA-binding LacI/PurR family transcriptional regulator
MKAQEFTIDDVAGKVGCSRVTIYNWLGGAKVSRAYQDRVSRFIERMEGK